MELAIGAVFELGRAVVYAIIDTGGTASGRA
jgi:hypothetical protein